MELAFSSDGLIPVVAQDRLTGEVRMVAYANKEAVEATIASGKATFFSRSRNELWEKGKTSGNALLVSDVLVDCDADCLLYLVTPSGPSCHTGAPSCFYRSLRSQETEAITPTTLLARLEETLEARKASSAAKSYAKSLFDAGSEKIGAKLREEADELARAVSAESDDRVASEAADLLFHTLVALRARGIAVRDVLAELDRRAGTSGHVEKANRG